MKRAYYNNGVITKRFYEGDEIPEGWVPGFAPKSEETKRKSIEKRKQTNLERYGTEFPAQSLEVQKKIEETNLKRYGTKAPSQSEEIKERARQTNLERYGNEVSSRSDSVKKKAEETNLKRYGAKSSAMNDEVKKKAAETCMERYGTKSPTQSEKIQEKIRNANLQNLGVEYPMQSEEVREKSRQTVQEKYGVDSVSQADKIIEKKKQTNLEHYGVEYSFQAEEVRERAKQTNLERYGVENPFQKGAIRDEFQQRMQEVYGTPFPTQSEEVKKKIQETCMERYGVAWSCMRPECRAASSNDSGPNRYFEKLLSDRGISFEREFHLDGFSYDFEVNNILIEIDPFPTHNVLWSPFGDHSPRVGEDYHQRKSLLAEKYGFRCIHIFDWDDPEKVIDTLLRFDKERVYARKCDIREVPMELCHAYLSDFHLQGTCKGQVIRLGLYYEEELVSVMTFGKPRYNKSYQWELLRYCSSKQVIGGAERIFNHFIKDYNPESIISYCDRSKFKGEVYSRLGFSLFNQGKPSKHWYGIKDGRHLTDNLVRQKGVDLLFGTSYGKGTSNEQLLIDEFKYIPIFDCGQDTYVWENKE